MDKGFIDKSEDYTYRDWPKEDVELYNSFSKWAQTQIGRRQAHEKRLLKFRANISSISKINRKPVHLLIKDYTHLKEAILKIQNAKDYSAESKRDYITFLGRLFWFKKTGEGSLQNAEQELKKLIQYSPPENERKAPKEVITREEIREMVKYGRVIDKAIIFTLFETGCRIGEFLSMRKENIKETAEGFEIFVKGKTGERYVMVVEGSKYLGTWLETHPIRDKHGPVWVSEKNGEPLTEAGIVKRIRNIIDTMNAERKKKCEPLFKKPYNPHNFRHSRATELGVSPGMTEALLCKIFGWNDSATAKTYIHVSNAHVKRALLRTYGKAPPEEAKITQKECPKCHEVNSVASHYCFKCGSSMDSVKVVSNIETLKARVEELESKLKEQKKEYEELYETLAERLLETSKKTEEHLREAKKHFEERVK